MKYYELNNKVKIPCIGYGTWKLKNKEETIDIVNDAIKVGYRLIDTAVAYGNYEILSESLKKSSVKRKDLFISGKLWNDSRDYDKVIESCKKQIEDLGIDYFDLYLIHWPASPALYPDWKEKNKETWKAMEYLYNEGLVKAIGVCNFKVDHLESLLEDAKIKPMVNQIEFHSGQMQNDIVEYCKKNDILIEAWSPLGAGKMLKNEELESIANKYNVSIAQLCIRWCLQNEVLPIPKSKNVDRMKMNLDVFDFEISEEDMKVLNDMPYIGGSGLDSDTITLFG